MSSNNIETDKYQKQGVYATIDGFGSAQLFNFDSLYAPKNAKNYAWGPPMQSFGASGDKITIDDGLRLLNMGPMVVSGAPQFVYTTSNKLTPQGTMLKASKPKIAYKMQSVGNPGSMYVSPF